MTMVALAREETDTESRRKAADDTMPIVLYCIVLLPLLPLSVPEAFASGSQFTPPQTVCEARLDWRWG